MSTEELKALAVLLDKFDDWETEKQSLYGRKMDKALATSLISVLPAYGMTYDLKFTLYNGKTLQVNGYVSRNSAIQAANYFMANHSELPDCGSRPVSFTIV